MWRWCLVASLVWGCGAAERGPAFRDANWRPAPNQSVYLRAVYDDDPSINLGRFFKLGTKPRDMDESAAFPSRCSKAFSAKLINSGGTFDDTFTASSRVGGSLAVPIHGSAGGGYGSNGELRVRYTLKRVMRAAVDADALAKCCESAPDQCSGHYLAEFYMGDGEVYQFLGSEAEVRASGSYNVAGAGVDYQQGTAWKQLTSFKNMYFAYKTAAVSGQGVGGGTDLCGSDWRGKVPQSADGQYFVATSKPAATEQAAFDDALTNGRLQAVQFIGTVLKERRVQHAQDLDRVWQDQQELVTATEGVAKRIKDRCRAVVSTDRGHVATLLMFFPQPQIDEAAAEFKTHLESIYRRMNDATIGLSWCASTPAGGCLPDLPDRVHALAAGAGLKLSGVVEASADPDLPTIRQAAVNANSAKGLVVQILARFDGTSDGLHVCHATASATLWDSEAGKSIQTAKPAGYGSSGGYKGVVYVDKGKPVDACRKAVLDALKELEPLVAGWKAAADGR